MNTYSTSTGERVSQSQIDSRMRKAKAELLQNQIEEIGYNVCTECYRNDCKSVDCSHVVSVRETKNTGRAELCYSVENMRPVGRRCHAEIDGLNLQFQEQ